MQNTIKSMNLFISQTYMEENNLNNDIEKISEIKNVFIRLKRLKQLQASYTTPLSHSHITYYINQLKKKVFQCIFMCITILLILICLSFTIVRAIDYYNRFKNFDVSENTFNKAVSYFEENDYDAALTRLQKLYANGWKDYNTVHYISQIYQIQGKYDASAELLLDTLTNCYGLANISAENKLYIELSQLCQNYSLSSRVYTNVSNALEKIQKYTQLYMELDQDIKNGDYANADYLCQTLHSVGADGFYYTSYYANVLVNTDRISEAYKLIMDVVKNDNGYMAKEITVSQRLALVHYILLYLEQSQQDECYDYINNELPALDVRISDKSAEPFISYNDVNDLFTTNASILALNYIQSVDNIEIEEETTLINARECYYIKVLHYDGDTSRMEYFFMDMNQNIYIYKDGKYSLLPQDGSIDITTDKIFSQSAHSNIVLNFKHGTDEEYIFSLTDTVSNHTFFDSAPDKTSNFDSYFYFSIENASFTLFSSGSDFILLVTKDPEHNYDQLEGRYQLTD